MNQFCTYCIFALKNIFLIPSEIRKLIISMMLEPPRVYCGPQCTIFIDGDNIDVFGDRYPKDLFSLPGREIKSIDFSYGNDIIYLLKSNNEIAIYMLRDSYIQKPNYVVHKAYEFEV